MQPDDPKESSHICEKGPESVSEQNGSLEHVRFVLMLVISNLTCS